MSCLNRRVASGELTRILASSEKSTLHCLKSGLIWTTRKKCELTLQNASDYCITVLPLPAVDVSLHTIIMSVRCRPNCSATGAPVSNNVAKYLLNCAITTIFTLAGCYDSGTEGRHT